MPTDQGTMVELAGRISELDGSPICEVTCDVWRTSEPPDGYGGNLFVPNGFADRVTRGTNLLLDIDDGPLLRIVIVFGPYVSVCLSLAHFVSRGEALERGPS